MPKTSHEPPATPKLCINCQQPMPNCPPDVRVCRKCDLRRHNELPETITPELFVAESSWVFAKTMPEIPHEYTVRDLTNADARRTTAMGHAEFEWFVNFIREHGGRRKFRGRAYVYLPLGDWEYWTMGYKPEHTTIINRQRRS